MPTGVLKQAVRHPKAEGYNLFVDNTWFRTVAGGDAQFNIGSRDSLAQRQIAARCERDVAAVARQELINARHAVTPPLQ